MIGLLETAAASAAEPAVKWRSTMQSAYPSTVRIVSALSSIAGTSHKFALCIMQMLQRCTRKPRGVSVARSHLQAFLPLQRKKTVQHFQLTRLPHLVSPLQPRKIVACGLKARRTESPCSTLRAFCSLECRASQSPSVPQCQTRYSNILEKTPENR